MQYATCENKIVYDINIYWSGHCWRYFNNCYWI